MTWTPEERAAFDAVAALALTPHSPDIRKATLDQFEQARAALDAAPREVVVTERMTIKGHTEAKRQGVTIWTGALTAIYHAMRAAEG